MESNTRLKDISVLGAFALSVGTAIGWGSFVVTGTSFVSKAGPLGSIIGLIIGLLIMLSVAYCYHYMISKYPGKNGGIYSFAKHTIGGDHAFLISWFLIIIYSAILWANVSSFSLFARYIFGDTFQFGFHYKIGGYDVWLGEILLSTFFLCLFGGFVLFKKSITTKIQAGLVLTFLAIILAGFIIGAIMHKGGVGSYRPDFAPTDEHPITQITRIVGMSPWAFIGFESISHSSRNFKFAHKNTFKVLLAAVIVTAVVYILMCCISISAFPDEYSNWHEYLTSTGSLNGLDAIPAFYVMHRYIGVPGLILFGIALFAVIATSIIGNLYALCGICRSMASDGVLPKFLKKSNKNDIPQNVVFFHIGLAFAMLFFGRVLIGWIVDINNICGIIVYTYIAVLTIYQGFKDKDKKGKIMGFITLGIGTAFAIAFIILSIFSIGWVEKESIAIFLVWAIIGYVYYAILLKRDKKKMFGHSMAATFGLYSLIIYSVGTWLAIMTKTYEDTSLTVAGTVVFILVAIGTQIVFFIVFNIIRKREVDMQNKLVLGMATMVEGRDNSTGGHIKRTSKVVELIVDEMVKDNLHSMNHRFYTNIIKAAPMHDLGKITVDDSVLRKPGKFTPEEFAQMKTHSAEGAKIVANILDGSTDEYFKEIAINVAHYHHERWDGTGYPCGLKGEEIPLEARIMAIADVYDALVSKRVYKDEFSFEEAKRIILENMGKQFDKGLEKYFLRAREKIEAFYSENK